MFFKKRKFSFQTDGHAQASLHIGEEWAGYRYPFAYRQQKERILSAAQLRSAACNGVNRTSSVLAALTSTRYLKPSTSKRPKSVSTSASPLSVNPKIIASVNQLRTFPMSYQGLLDKFLDLTTKDLIVRYLPLLLFFVLEQARLGFLQSLNACDACQSRKGSAQLPCVCGVATRGGLNPHVQLIESKCMQQFRREEVVLHVTPWHEGIERPRALTGSCRTLFGSSHQ